MNLQVWLPMTLLMLGLACKKPDEAAPPVKKAEPSAARPTSPSLDQYLTSSPRDDERKPLSKWDAAAAQQYLEACAKANEPLNAFRVRDCTCETDRWTGREYQEWKLKQLPVNVETCSTSAGRKAWFGAKTSAFLVTCARDGQRSEACQCLVEVLFTRNLTEERLHALTAEKDAEVLKCTTAAESPRDLKADLQAGLEWCADEANPCDAKAAERIPLYLADFDPRACDEGYVSDANEKAVRCTNAHDGVYVEFKRDGGDWQVTSVRYLQPGD